ncbi:dTMP kinase [Streptomyces sp. NPDC093589]|uniref:dTMP kinase n=1 Tax=Streptomyces sp. NPDC093589 TaxID=3366043 RepID=UPI00381F41FB
MTAERKGFFVTIDGPSGVGKSTTIEELHTQLATRGVPAQRTTEPPKSGLGNFTRQHAGQIHGLSLACLVAAARYQHIETTIAPALVRGDLLISDRYVASTLVLQQLDGVPVDFLLEINRYAPMPDLAVILTAAPGRIAERIAEAGVTHRFRGDPTAPSREVDLYRDAAVILTNAGVQVLVLDTSDATPLEVASQIADAIPPLPLPSVAPATSPTPQES